MNLHHFISSIDRSAGGPSQSTTNLIVGLIKYPKINVVLHTGYSNDPLILRFSKRIALIQFYKLNRFGCIDFSNKNIIKSGPILFHGHGIWDLIIHQMSVLGRKSNILYVISPRGMLEPWALKQGSLKKKIALWVYQFKDLKNANCIHATSLSEADNIRKLGLMNPIAVIPNGIDLSSVNIITREIDKKVKKALFLSRIHPKKGIENLLDAWGRLPEMMKKDWRLDIVGNGEEGYLKKLNSKINELNLQNQVSIIGPLYDDKKNLAYQSADLFVLPTYSENFGMVVAEAMAFGLPVITTKGAPWEELETYNAGWWIDIGVEPLIHVLTEAMHKSTETLNQMGANGRLLVEQNYSIEAVSTKMIQMYNWIINPSQPKPDFIHIK